LLFPLSQYPPFPTPGVLREMCYFRTQFPPLPTDYTQPDPRYPFPFSSCLSLAHSQLPVLKLDGESLTGFHTAPPTSPLFPLNESQLSFRSFLPPDQSSPNPSFSDRRRLITLFERRPRSIGQDLSPPPLITVNAPPAPFSIHAKLSRDFSAFFSRKYGQFPSGPSRAVRRI